MRRVDVLKGETAKVVAIVSGNMFVLMLPRHDKGKKEELRL
jgi:hypothetical protein